MVKRVIVVLISILFLCAAQSSSAAESASAPLAKLIQAAKAEKEFTLLGGGGTWGDADAQKMIVALAMTFAAKLLEAHKATKSN